jgi:hypothetical protein
LKPAEEQLLEVIEREPTEYYAHLMLARTLERQSRACEATKHRRIAAALTGDDSMLGSPAHLLIRSAGYPQGTQIPTDGGPSER